MTQPSLFNYFMNRAASSYLDACASEPTPNPVVFQGAPAGLKIEADDADGGRLCRLLTSYGDRWEVNLYPIAEAREVVQNHIEDAARRGRHWVLYDRTKGKLATPADWNARPGDVIKIRLPATYTILAIETKERLPEGATESDRPGIERVAKDTFKIRCPSTAAFTVV
jgi:hypothetical protein